MTEPNRAYEIAQGWRCPDCDIPLLITRHMDDCPGVAALNSAWRVAFPKDDDDPMGWRSLPSPWVAFEAAWWAGRQHERNILT